MIAVLALPLDDDAVRGLVPLDALADVLGPGALDDLEGHDWAAVQASEHVVVLSPGGARFARLVGELRRICDVKVTAIPRPPPLAEPEGRR